MAKLLDPHGMQIDRPKRVMVFIEEESGRMHGWEVDDGGLGLSAEYQLAHPDGDAHARVVVAGRFHRIAKDQESVAIERAMNDGQYEIAQSSEMGDVIEVRALEAGD